MCEYIDVREINDHHKNMNTTLTLQEKITLADQASVARLSSSQKHAVAICSRAGLTLADLADGLTEKGALRFMSGFRHQYHTLNTSTPLNMLPALYEFVDLCLFKENREGHQKWISPFLREKIETVKSLLLEGGYSWDRGVLEFGKATIS
jgi:hypothetical protein